jgi:hypothetical protein
MYEWGRLRFAQTCGYKKCRPYQLNDNTWIYPAPVLSTCLVGNMSEFMDVLTQALRKHGQKAGHKLIKIVDA